MGGGSNTSSGDAPVNSTFNRRIKKLVIKKKQEQQRAIDDFRRQMNFPAEVNSTSYINIGSGNGGSQTNDEETATTNKSNTYNRNSKRGTRLVRSSKNG